MPARFCAGADTSDAPLPTQEGHTELDGAPGRAEPPDPAPDGAQGGSSEDEDEETSRQQKALKKRSFVIQELVDTEREYIRSLGQVRRHGRKEEGVDREGLLRAGGEARVTGV